MAHLLVALAEHPEEVGKKLKDVNVSSTAKVVKTRAIDTEATATIGGFIRVNAMCQAGSTSFKPGNLEAYFSILLK